MIISICDCKGKGHNSRRTDMFKIRINESSSEIKPAEGQLITLCKVIQYIHNICHPPLAVAPAHMQRASLSLSLSLFDTHTHTHTHTHTLNFGKAEVKRSKVNEVIRFCSKVKN